MEGPTPVSALIHAATMVTAGVFLIIRCSPLFEYSADSLLIITIIGSMTAFFAASIGIVQNDMKKVIAYSTCSQLGYMIFACGISAYNVSFFHLINHAFFKALLFLGSGIIIHALNNEQDMRRMGGLLKVLPYSYNMMLIGSLALIGFPFLSGFYSKDLILESAYSQYKIQSIFSYNLGSLSAFFTAFYSGRLLYLTFLGFNNQFRWNKNKIYEADQLLGLPLLILVVGSIFSGFIFKDMFVGFGSVYFDNSILILSSNSINFDIEKIPLAFKLLPTVFTFLGLSFSYLFYSSNYIKLMPKFFIYVYIFLNQK
jgi:NADH:ubiquinone oxidoreductase subunit 5 (subunit L)/multisubunit Na+/H+ antiporter MnhA subunit